MVERRWLTVRECSEYLAIHPKTVYCHISRGEIPAAKIGGSVRIDKKKLDAMMEASEKTPIESKLEGWGL